MKNTISKQLSSCIIVALFCLTSVQAQTTPPAWECYTDGVTSPHVPTSSVVSIPCIPSTSPGTDFNSFYVHKENYKPVNGVVEPLYVHKTIKILFHVMQPDISGGTRVNYEDNPTDKNRLQEIIDKINYYLTNVKVPAAPISAVCGSCHVTDSRFRVAMAKKADGVTNDIRFHSEGLLFEEVFKHGSVGAGPYDGSLNPYFENTEGVLNVFLMHTDDPAGPVGGVSWGSPEYGYFIFSGINNNIPFIVTENYYRSSDLDYISSNLLHEIGHTMTTHHAFSPTDESCSEANFDYLSDAFGTTATGTKVCPVSERGTDIFMTYGFNSNYMTPLQIARWHRNAHFLSCRKYIYNTYPEDINHDHTGQGQIYSYNITKNETWDFDIKMYNDIIVKSGNKLTIKCRVLMPYHSNIIVEPGAELIVDGGIITSHHDTTMWYGISVWGNASKSQITWSDHGMVTINNGATISNALHAVMLADAVYYDPSRNGGLAHINDAHFINNRRSIGFHDYHNFYWEYKGGMWTRTWLRPNESWIYRTTFETNNGMIRDPKGQVTMSSVDGVPIVGCSFINTMPYSAASNRCVTGCPQQDAIVSWNSTFNINQYKYTTGAIVPSYVKGFRHGVLAQSFAVSNNFGVQSTTFENNLFGVRTSGVNSFGIKGNTFLMDNPVNSVAASIGAKLEKSSLYRIYYNTFGKAPGAASPGIGVEVLSGGGDFNKVNNNVYNDLRIGNYANKNNSNGEYDITKGEDWSAGLEFLCNTHNNNYESMVVDGVLSSGKAVHGIRRIQGSSTLATGNEFNLTYSEDLINDLIGTGPFTLPINKYCYYTLAANQNPKIRTNVILFGTPFQNTCAVSETSGGGSGGSTGTGGGSSSIAATAARLTLAAAYDDYSTERPTLLNNALLNMQSPYAEIERSLLHMQQGEVTQGMAIYNAIIPNMALTPEELTDFTLGATLMRMIAGRYAQSNTPRWDSLTNSELDSIRYVRDNTTMWANARACNWLSYAIGEDCAIEMPNIPETNNNQRRALEGPSIAEDGYLNIKPNPGMDYFDIAYVLEGAQDASLIVSDAAGRKILQGTLPALQKTYHINAKDWASGVYLYQVSQNGKSLYNGKLIKQ